MTKTVRPIKDTFITIYEFYFSGGKASDFVKKLEEAGADILGVTKDTITYRFKPANKGRKK